MWQQDISNNGRNEDFDAMVLHSQCSECVVVASCSV